MREWCEVESPAGTREALEKAGFAPLMARILASRGVTPETAAEFFSPSLKNLAPPSALPGAAEAAEEILAAVREGREIVVFGDYDCDGVCATAILVKALEALGAKAKPFIPDRLSEGYGMSDASVSRMLAENPGAGLVVTVDNGIGSAAHAAALKARGIRVVVTDHHLPGEILPDCTVVNPKVAAPENLEGLCGAGVAFMIANALVARAKEEGMYSGGSVGGPLLVLAGLATVTDIMPLRGQNRTIVAEALRLFPKYAPCGLRELLERAARSGAQTLKSRDFGFLLGPRINASGRLGSGMEALKLVLSRDREEARELARRVDLLNMKRKNVEQKMTDAALEIAKPGEAAYAIEMPDGHRGVAGIVAARVLERLADAGCAVPVCVTVDGRGSGRAPEGYNIRDAFAECAEFLSAFGGHAAAGGLSVKPGAMEDFRKNFALACERQARSAGGRAGAVRFDAWVETGDLAAEFVESLEKLEPFGEGNPVPVFAVRGAILSGVKRIGSDGRHLGLEFRNAPRGVWWNRGGEADRLRRESARPVDVMFTATVSDYGERHVEMRVCAMRPSQDRTLPV